MKLRLAILAIAISQVAAVVPPRPLERIPPAVPPTVSAASWILYDDTNGVVLDGVDVDVPRPMASTTKLMTALLAMESGRLGDTVVVSQRAADVGESEIGLVAGERIGMDMLLHAMLIRSANDAAIAIAEHVGGSVEGFVQMMNDRAAELGLDSTSFANPHGLDARGHHSSARDLLTLALLDMTHPEFADIVKTVRYRITDAPDGTERVAESTNQLLTTYRGAIGVKTGYTFGAGLVLVAAAERDGRRLYAVVMGSEGIGAHFKDAAALLDYGFDDLQVVDVVRRGTPFHLERAADRAAVAATARVATLLYLSSLGSEPVVEAPAAPVEVATSSDVLTAEVPGVSDALGWLVGGRSGG